MANGIDLWAKMYKNEPPWKEKNIKLCGLPAAIAGEFARLVTLELKTEVTGNDFINEEYQAVISDIRKYTEYACAKGGLAMKPYASEGHIEVDMVQADRFFPTKFNSRGEVTAAVFAESLTVGKKVYTRLEYHQHEGTMYHINNKAFVKQDLDNVEVLGKEVPLTAVPEWANLQEEVTLKNVKMPLFAYFKNPNANNVDDTSPLGVSVYSRAINDIKEADNQWTRLLWEFEGSELAIDADITLFKNQSKEECLVHFMPNGVYEQERKEAEAADHLKGWQLKCTADRYSEEEGAFVVSDEPVYLDFLVDDEKEKLYLFYFMNDMAEESEITSFLQNMKENGAQESEDGMYRWMIED